MIIADGAVEDPLFVVLVAVDGQFEEFGTFVEAFEFAGHLPLLEVA